MATALTTAQAQQFKRDGYTLINRPIFPAATFQQLKAYMMDRLAEAKSAQGVPHQLIDCPHWHDAKYFDWLLADEMLDLVEPVIGPDIGIFACHLLQKPAGTGKRVPWHKDSQYWAGILTPVTVASVTLALEPSIKENSCLRVIPGSHDDKALEVEPVDKPDEAIFGVEVVRKQIDDTKAVDLELQPNEASLHDGHIIHGSNLNRSSLFRAVWTVRYFPTTVKFDTSFSPYFKNRPFHVFLARGRDRAGNRYSEPGKTNDKLTGATTA